MKRSFLVALAVTALASPVLAQTAKPAPTPTPTPTPAAADPSPPPPPHARCTRPRADVRRRARAGLQGRGGDDRRDPAGRRHRLVEVLRVPRHPERRRDAAPALPGQERRAALGPERHRHHPEGPDLLPERGEGQGRAPRELRGDSAPPRQRRQDAGPP